MTADREAERLDLRLLPASAAAWGAAAVGLGWRPGLAIATAVVLWAAGAALAGRHLASIGRCRFSIAIAIVIAGGALAAAGLRAAAVQAGPLAGLAAESAAVHVSGRVTSDPVRKEGSFAPYVLVSLTADVVTARGTATAVRSPVLVIGQISWLDVAYGQRVDAFGHLEKPDGPDLAAVLIAAGSPRITAPPGWLTRQIAHVRAGLTEAASPLPPSERALLPALVDGDDSLMPAETTADFTTTGLTHLLAVSGSNLTLVLGFVLFAARWLRVKGYALGIVGAVAVLLFVLLARPEPSVLRAAAMGLVALAGLSSGSRARGIRVLCVAVIVLVLADPWLARSIGFVLSTLATLGILLLASRWRDLLSRWLPRPLAEAVAVPLAAQIVCTPVIATLSGQVSMIAVLANIAVAPAIGPATVASLLAGLVALVSDGLGHLAGRVAGLPLWWIVWVATHGARVSGASVPWGADAVSVGALALLCLAVVALTPVVLPRPLPCLLVAGALILALLHPPGRLGWPPGGWVMVMCDVGQGDGLVLNAGQGIAVVVDTGPDPKLMDACLDRLDVDEVALVVLTHFHADHVNGLPAVLAGRPVNEIETSPYAAPIDRSRAVTEWAAAAGVPVTVAAVGERRRVGQLRWQVIGPPPLTTAGAGSGDEGSGPNNASIIMLVRVNGVRILLTGDAEPEEEDAILATGIDLHVDVLKEAHHGSSAQDPRFLAATGAAVSLISVGAHNTYGHPAPQTLAWLEELGMRAYRTDQSGDIALVVRESELRVVTVR